MNRERHPDAQPAEHGPAAEDHAAHGDMHTGDMAHTAHGAAPAHGAGAAHDRHAGHSVAMFRDRFWLSLLLTLPVVFWSADVQAWLGYRAPTFPGSEWIAPVLGTVTFVYGGLVFVRGAPTVLAGCLVAYDHLNPTPAG